MILIIWDNNNNDDDDDDDSNKNYDNTNSQCVTLLRGEGRWLHQLITFSPTDFSSIALSMEKKIFFVVVHYDYLL